MSRALVAIALFCVSVSAQDGSPLALAESDSDGAPLAMAESESGSCYQTDRTPEAMTALAQKKSDQAAKAAGDTLKSIAEAEYALAISNSAQQKAGAIANANKAYEIATTTASATHYQLALQSAGLKQQETLHHDMKHVVAKRAKAEADAVAQTKLKMEAIARKHQSEVDLANGLAKRAGEQGKMAADEQLATDKASVLTKTKSSFLKIMNEHKAALKVIRDAATAKIAILTTESTAEEARLKTEALTKKTEMLAEAKTIYDAAVAKAGADEVAMKIRAESKKKVLIAEATNGATNAANQAWVKAFKDEMSFGAPCQAHQGR